MFGQQVDKSGVKPNTISLPTGPGSIEGLGESFQPSLNTGQGSYGVNIVVPPGTAGFAPSVSLSYNGGSGNSPLGYGWKNAIPFVQRQSDKGIPLYTDAANGFDDDRDGQIDEVDELDVFINELKEELVLTESGFHFCEIEGAFIRYKRVGEHWEGTLPDGTLMEFGLTNNSRVIDAETGNVHCWLLERMTDTNGNEINYSYTSFDCAKDLNQKYLHQITYGPGAGPWQYFHFVQFNYEDRLDWFEDCRSGFRVRTGMRLKEIITATQGVALDGHLAGDFNKDGTTDYLNRKYLLTYKRGIHWSLLSNVTWIGADGVTPYPSLSFEYSNVAPADTISAEGKIIGAENAPFQLMDNPFVEIIDLNGDGLPDILKTEQDGFHSVTLNQGEKTDSENTVISWSQPVEVGTEDGLAWGINLQDGQNAIAHLADMDADGLSDLVYKASNEEEDVYYFSNKGDNNWGTRQRMNVAQGGAPPSPFGQRGVKTADIDFDKHIDIIQSIDAGGGHYYKIWLNQGNQQYTAFTAVQENGYDLSGFGVRIADFNGDRIPDIVWIRPSSIIITAGLGYGEFADPMFVPMPDYTFSNDFIEKSKLQDINGDGLVDLIVERPKPNELWYWINQGNYSLDKKRVITGMPTISGLNPAIRWADMNGNGTTDYVYADKDASPRLQVLDIGQLIGAAPSPNLLLTIDNGIGQKTRLEYATSTKYLLADRANGKEWKEPLPFPVNVVSKLIIEDGMGNEYETQFTYHDGYYDGKEKEFRGFAMVESREVGDESAPDLIMAYEFDTGAKGVALKGKELSVEARNAQDEIFYREENQWLTKVLHEEVNQDGRKVTYAYPSEKIQDVIEKENGTPVQIKWGYEYDDYGNQIKKIEFGRMEEGWDDERVTNIEYSGIFPSGKSNWIINKEIEEITSDEKDSIIAHSKTYYDHNIELGIIDKGNETRIEDWVDSTKFVVSSRYDYDKYGNVITSYDPLYGIQSGHFKVLNYDSLFYAYPIQEIIHTGKEIPKTLNYHASYDYGFGIVLTSTEFNGFNSFYEYDVFGRLITLTKPLDSIPTSKFDYVLGQSLPEEKIINWIETSHLDNSQGDGYLHARTFVDGLGREIMTRSEGEDEGQVVVTNTVQFNKRKKPHKKYLPYFESGTLDFNNPTFNTGFAEHFYDALSRPTRINTPLGPKGNLFSSISYSPLVSFEQDEEQTNPVSKNFGCGKRKIFDGLEYGDGNRRMREHIEVVKLSDEGESIDDLVEWKTIYEYDLQNNLTRFTDAQNNVKIMHYDGLSRKIFSNDPNKGKNYFLYDDANNPIQVTDAKHQTIKFEFDGINRLEAEYYGLNKQIPDVRYYYDTPFGELNKGKYWTKDTSQINAKNALGYLSWVKDLSGEEHTSYDERGRVDWMIKRIQNNEDTGLYNFFTGYKYDSKDRVIQFDYPDGDSINYIYNNRGLLESIPQIIDKYDYNPTEQNALLHLANGTVTNYSYDHRLRLDRIHTLRSNDGLFLQDLNYTYDGVSNILQIRDGRPNNDIEVIGQELGLSQNQARKHIVTQEFQYDNLYRLNQALNQDIYGEINYRYDRTGNMTQKTATLIEENPKMNLGKVSSGGNLGSWDRIGKNENEPAGPNAVTEVEQGGSFLYDANGNLINQDGHLLSWDFKDRLTSVATDTSLASYLYDYTNTRIRKIKDTLSVFYINQYIELRGNELLKYVYAGSERISQIKTNTVNLERDTFFFHQDQIGSTSLTTSTNAKVVEQIANHPFGLVRQSHTSNLSEKIANYTYTGAEQDKESENFYLGERFYNPKLGRFISVDPLVNDPDQIDKSSYAYTWNNPIRRVDKDGQIPVETIADVASIGWSAYNLYNEPSWANAGFLLWDVGATVIPYVPGSYVAKGAKAAGQVAKIGKGGKVAAQTGKAAAKGSKTAVIKAVAKQGCFIAGTKIWTQKGYQRIENIKAGDLAWAFDEYSKKVILKEVLGTLVREVNHLRVLITNKDTIFTTDEHPFYVNKKWLKAKDLKVNNLLANHYNREIRIVKSYRIDTLVTVYNFSVNQHHNYFISQLTILVHNNNCAAAARVGAKLTQTAKFSRGSRVFKLHQGTAKSGWKHIFDRHIDPSRFLGKSKFSSSMSQGDILKLLGKTLKHGKESNYAGKAVFQFRAKVGGVYKKLRATVNSDGTIQTFHALDKLN